MRDADRQYIAKFVEIVGNALEEHPGALTGIPVLYAACAQQNEGQFMPVSTFARLVYATGYRRYRGRLVLGLHPKDPAFRNRVTYLDQ